MITPRIAEVTRTAAVAALALLLAIAWPLIPMTARAQESGGEAEALGGYTVSSSGAPFSMLFYEPVFPIPVDPGEPHAEGTLSYTSSRVETGPSTRAVASSTWPGPALGDGFKSVCECEEEWFVKAEARNPGGEEEAEQQIPELGAGMKATAKGFEAVARAGSGESPNEDGAAFGTMRSNSSSNVKDSVTTATTVAVAKGVKLAAGVISIDSVKTTLEATSDGKKATSKGQTKVNGLVIAGQGYVVDEKGLQPVADEKPEESVLPVPKPKEIPGAEELRKNLGIEVHLVEHEVTKNGPADVARRAGGLRIIIDTAVLKDKVPLYELIPPDIAGRIAPLLVFGPKIEYILGRGAVRAAATEPLEIPDMPLLDEPIAPPPPVEPPADMGAEPAFADTASEDVALSDDLGAGEDTGGAVEQPLAAGEQTQPAAAELPALFGGLPPGLVAVGMVLAALGGRALAGFTGAAMGGAGGALCEQGAPRQTPNLR